MNKKKTELRLENHRRYLDSIENIVDNNPPNIVLVFVDDMGYGDISCFGSTAIHTPHLDALAENGVKMNNFYASSPICSPSRFGCLTGRYPTRGFIHSVFFPDSHPIGKIMSPFMFPYGVRGILPDEITIAEALQAGGYKTGMFGKWHLGDKSPYLPNEKGFDYFFGSYYSNDMKPYAYYRNDDLVIEAPADQTTLTKAIAGEIVTFIDDNKDNPFFVYYPSPFPHDPVHASSNFAGTSHGGTYGDCVQELDWSIGEIVRKLDEHGLTENTLIIFTSDNGPWFEGNPGYHRGRKNNSFDGGQMVPFIASWPDEIPKGIEVDAVAMNIDFFPTILKMAGIPLPNDREIDGVDMLPLLKNETSETIHDDFYFIKGKKVMGVRTKDNFKYIDRHRCENGSYWIAKQGPFLFDLNFDPTESYNARDHFPEKFEAMQEMLEGKREEMESNPRGWKLQ
ncbi:sulfatase [Candidatus Leptofilum sp.]|uniref:sulfatase family protein n=1 Tax=Candidatus Leptofilum sp. TaxID=3241576 RepID=UPI003B5AE257